MFVRLLRAASGHPCGGSHLRQATRRALGGGQKEIEVADKEDLLNTDALRPRIGVSETRSGNRRRMLATAETTDCWLASRRAVDSQPPGRLR
jgi:hypothetical protein